MPFSLYERFVRQGTLSEPNGIPDPKYALPSTIHWVRALSMAAKNHPTNYQEASKFYSNVQKRVADVRVENSIFEHLMLGLHQASALRALKEASVQSDVTRVASVAWYYGVYASATAMIAAQDGTLQDNHTQTANSWDRQFAQRGLAMPPFDLRVSTCLEKAANQEIDSFRKGPKTNLVEPFDSLDKAHDYMCAYLAGTRSWYEWRACEELRKSKDFKNLGVSDFRTKAARGLRDQRLSGMAVSFIHQAIRFRGKANYRESLYLGHGNSVETQVRYFISDLSFVLEAFLAMAGAFSFKRLGSDLRSDFLNDIKKYQSFSLDANEVWS
jgi:hypothetical protein